MPEPAASRPHMPGYGVPAPGEDDDGLLPWSWAEERLRRGRNYWLVTTGPDGEPHPMPVWGLWTDDGFVFSTGGRSRKARHLADNARCAVHTEDGAEPVVVWGSAEVLSGADEGRAIAAYAAKYGMAPPEPGENPVYLVRPERAFGVIEREEDFARSATRWDFR